MPRLNGQTQDATQAMPAQAMPALTGAALLAEIDRLRAENARLLLVSTSGGNRPLAVKPKRGVSQKGANMGKPYAGVQVSGPFPPMYMSMGVAETLLANGDTFMAGLRAAVAELHRTQ